MAHRAGPRADQIACIDLAGLHDAQHRQQLSAPEIGTARVECGQRRQRAHHRVAAHGAAEVAFDAPDRQQDVPVDAETGFDRRQQRGQLGEFLPPRLDTGVRDQRADVFASGLDVFWLIGEQLDHLRIRLRLGERAIDHRGSDAETGGLRPHTPDEPRIGRLRRLEFSFGGALRHGISRLRRSLSDRRTSRDRQQNAHDQHHRERCQRCRGRRRGHTPGYRRHDTIEPVRCEAGRAARRSASSRRPAQPCAGRGRSANGCWSRSCRRACRWRAAGFQPPLDLLDVAIGELHDRLHGVSKSATPAMRSPRWPTNTA